MATSVNTGTPLWLDGCTNDAGELRIASTGLYNRHQSDDSNTLYARSGVMPDVTGIGNILSAPGGMTVRVRPITYVIQGTDTATQGVYQAATTSNSDLSAAAADPTYTRLDRVCATITDVGTSSSTSVIKIITGTPASSPVLPALPASSLHLGYVTVPAGTISLSAGNITNDALYTVANGGILPVVSSGTYPTEGPQGFLNDLTMDQLMYFKSGVVYPNNRLFNCTSLTRPANKLTATTIYETDTGCIRIWDSADWRLVTDTQWQTYTPVWSSSGTQPNIGNGSITGKYFRTGKKIVVEIRMTLGTTSTAGTGTYYWSLPVASSTPTYAENLGSFVLSDAGGSTRSGQVTYATGPKLYVLYQALVAGTEIVATALTAGSPLTWNTNDFIAISAQYEIA